MHLCGQALSVASGFTVSVSGLWVGLVGLGVWTSTV